MWVGQFPSNCFENSFGTFFIPLVIHFEINSKTHFETPSAFYLEIDFTNSFENAFAIWLKVSSATALKFVSWIFRQFHLWVLQQIFWKKKFQAVFGNAFRIPLAIISIFFWKSLIPFVIRLQIPPAISIKNLRNFQKNDCLSLRRGNQRNSRSICSREIWTVEKNPKIIAWGIFKCLRFF